MELKHDTIDYKLSASESLNRTFYGIETVL